LQALKRLVLLTQGIAVLLELRETLSGLPRNMRLLLHI
jgi:hypothetical protein